MTVEINDGHYLELMDRIHIIMCNINDHLLSHPLAEKMVNVQGILNEAAEKLGEAYQLVGQAMPEDDKVICKVPTPCSSRMNGECQLIEPCSKFDLLNKEINL